MSVLGEQAYSEALTGTTAFTLSRIECFTVAGPDALRYTHGRITQNIRDLQLGASANFMLLTPQGRLISLGRAGRLESSLILLAETQQGASFTQSFLQFKVADQLELQTPFTTPHYLLLLGPQSPATLAMLFPETNGELCAESAFAGRPVLIIPAHAAPIPGYFLVLEKDSVAEIEQTLLEKAGVTLYSSEDFEVTRISLRLPSSQFELEEKCIATDYPYESYISFKKGCYSGQEVVEMSTARGRPNRKLVSLSLPSSIAIPIGTEIHTNESRCGKVTSSCYLPMSGEARCMAFIKFTVDADTPLFIDGKECRVLS